MLSLYHLFTVAPILISEYFSTCIKNTTLISWENAERTVKNAKLKNKTKKYFQTAAYYLMTGGSFTIHIFIHFQLSKTEDHKGNYDYI